MSSQPLFHLLLLLVSRCFVLLNSSVLSFRIGDILLILWVWGEKIRLDFAFGKIADKNQSLHLNADLPNF